MYVNQSNSYRKDLSWVLFDNQVQERHQVKDNSPAYPFLQLIQQFQVATKSTSPYMTKVFHTWSNGRFIKKQSKLRRKKLYRKNQGSSFLGGSFTNKDNVTVPIQFRRQ